MAGTVFLNGVLEIQLRCKTQVGHQRRAMPELLCAKIHNIRLAQILKRNAFNRDKIFAF